VGPDDADDAGLRERERQVLDEQPIAEALAQVVDSDDGVAEALADGDGISKRSGPRSAASASCCNLSYAPKRALPFDWRAFGDMRTHSSSRSRVRRRASLDFSSFSRRACFCSSQLL